MGLRRPPLAQAKSADFIFHALTFQFLRPGAISRWNLIQFFDKTDFTMAIDIEEPRLIVRYGNPSTAVSRNLTLQKIIQILLRAADNKTHQAGPEIEIDAANPVEALRLGWKIDHTQVRRQKNQHKQRKPDQKLSELFQQTGTFAKPAPETACCKPRRSEPEQEIYSIL